MVLITIPMRLVSEANQREHWAQKQRRVRAQREEVYLRLWRSPHRRPTLPCTITITRIAPRMLDGHDNLSGSAKAVVDGMSDWLAGAYGTGEDRQVGLTWRYAQRPGKPKEYAVEITIEDEAS